MGFWKKLFYGDSDDRVDYYGEGVELLNVGKYHEALTSFRLALREAPNDPAVLQQMAITYTRIGMNLYRDGHDSVAMHGDKLHTVAAGHPITLVSLGAPRRMLIRAREGRRETLAVDLAPGSVLSMSHASQSTHEHGIPKTRRAQGPRISVVFRVRPA